MGGGGEEASHDVIDWFGSWPTPFLDATEATAYFGGGGPGQTWAAGLEQTTTGLVPRFELATLHEAILAVHTQARWAEWATISCPTLVVKGGRGFPVAGRSRRDARAESQRPHGRHSRCWPRCSPGRARAAAAAISTFVGQARARTPDGETSGTAAEREPPNPSGFARITLVAQILVLPAMQSPLHLHIGSRVLSSSSGA